jgi:hypothetical protein
MDGGGGITVVECFSFDCKMNLYALGGSMTGQTYRDNIIRDNVVSYFDNKTDIHGQLPGLSQRKMSKYIILLWQY